MASLTQAAILTRKIVRYGIYFVIFLIVGSIFLRVITGVINTVFPKAPPPPTVLFGKLPKLPFAEKRDLPSLSYKIETPEGSLPTFPGQAKVYFMPQARADLLALDNAGRTAASLGFVQLSKKISDSLYQFSDGANSILEMNIINKTFSLAYNLNADPSPINFRPPAAETALAAAKSFLTNGGLLADDLTGPVTQEYLKIQNKQLVSAISLSEANFVKINLFRKDYDKLPSVTPNPNQANIWFIISGDTDRNKQIVGAQYFYFPVDETQFATYPIKKSEQAFSDLQNGKGYIANLGQNQNGKITIRRIYLAYFDSGVAQNFYQPVVVFEGDNGFVAYVPAISSSYYSE
jgi:hypothetical protein